MKRRYGKVDAPLLLVYEEAYKYAPKSNLAKYRASTTSIERIAKEGSKYGVTLAIVSERPSEVSGEREKVVRNRLWHRVFSKISWRPQSF